MEGGGFRVFDVWETREGFDRFVEEALGPAIEEVTQGQAGEPNRTIYELHNVMKLRRHRSRLRVELRQEREQLGHDGVRVLAVRPVAGTRNEQRPARRRQQLGRAGEEIGLDQVGRPADDEPGHGRDLLDHGKGRRGRSR